MQKSHQSLSLNGIWSLSWNPIGHKTVFDVTAQNAFFLPTLKGSYLPDNTLVPTPIPCSVPGDIHLAFMEQSFIQDPSIGLHSLDCKWLEAQEFWYQKEFLLTEYFISDKLVLTFEGLDLTSDIWINDTYLGRHNNAFISVDFDITNLVSIGQNTLTVRIDQGLSSVIDKPMEDMGKMWNNDQPYRAWMRKPQYVYGWDWTIWLPSCGIWKGVHLSSYTKAHIQDVYVYDVFQETSFSTSELHIDITTQLIESRSTESASYDETTTDSKSHELTLQCFIYSDSRFDSGQLIYTNDKLSLKPSTQVLTSYLTHDQITLQNPNLWWPNQSGNPYLYNIEIRLVDKNNCLIDSKKIRHGVRKVGLRQERLNSLEKGFTFMINDTPIFCKGANHVPVDCLPGRITDDKTCQLLQMATDCHMNMIRVWGGGIYESNAFMETCDENGLMVWHDFMFACGYHPDFDSHFFEDIRIEATQAIKRMRNYASLIGWSGNNEIQDMYFGMKQWIKDLPWYGGTIFEQLLPELIDTYCVNTLYRESSPFGEKGAESCIECGDQHIWHFTHRPDYEHFMDLVRFVDFDLKFLSEFGIIGAMNVASAKACISESAFYPDSKEWLYHSNNTSSHRLLHNVVDTYFGDYRQFTPEDFILRSQLIQAELIRIIYDEFQRKKFVCSGLLFWTLSDSIGIHNWSLIDYYLEKKPVYHYLKRTLNPLKIVFKGYQAQNFDAMHNYLTDYSTSPKHLDLWIVSDFLENTNVVMEYFVMDFYGRILDSHRSNQTAIANSSQVCCSIALDCLTIKPEETLVYATLKKDDVLIHENKYLLAPFRYVHCLDADLSVWLLKLPDGRTQLTLSSSTFIWMLHIDIDTLSKIQCSDNDFDIYPGVERTIYLDTYIESTDVLKWSSMNPLAIRYGQKI